MVVLVAKGSSLMAHGLNLGKLSMPLESCGWWPEPMETGMKQHKWKLLLGSRYNSHHGVIVFGRRRRLGLIDVHVRIEQMIRVC